MDEKKFISFIIPAYNAEQTIKRCLESISFISRNDMEVLVIDDGSEDDTSKICNNLKDSRIHIISQKNRKFFNFFQKNACIFFEGMIVYRSR